MIDLAKLREFLAYNPETGEFRWLKNKSRGHVGGLAGAVVATTGYRRIWFDGERVFAHRLAFALMTGEWPETVDHINRIRDDNRWANLRAATRSQQQGNRKRSAMGTRGIRMFRGKWKAALMLDKKRFVHLGTFETQAQAQAAYDRAAIRHFGEFYAA